jgi:hypothetical protein
MGPEPQPGPFLLDHLDRFAFLSVVIEVTGCPGLVLRLGFVGGAASCT